MLRARNQKATEAAIPTGTAVAPSHVGVHLDSAYSEGLIPFYTEAGCSQYRGTRAALQAEKIIPERVQWPEGRECTQWDDGIYGYTLGRIRPPKVTSGLEQLDSADWWVLMWSPIHGSLLNRLRACKEKELVDFDYRNSAEGRQELSELLDRYFKATRDADYQAFRARIPGLGKKVRGGRSDAATGKEEKPELPQVTPAKDRRKARRHGD